MAKKWQTTINNFKAVRSENANKIAGFGIIPAGACKETLPNLIRFPLLVADAVTKKEVLQYSQKMGLGISDGYPDSIDGIYELRNDSGGNSFPVAKDIAERIVTLPVHPYVNEVDIRNIVQLFQ